MNIELLALTNGDLEKAAVYLRDIPDDAYATHAMRNLAAPIAVRAMGKTGSDTREVTVGTCRKLDRRLRLACIEGFAFGFMEHGEPGVEYKRALDVCSLAILSEEERTGCSGYIYSYLPMWYSEAKAREICGALEGLQRTACSRAVNDMLRWQKNDGK